MPILIIHSFGGNFFSRYLTKQLAEFLPRRIKRLLYVSSAMGLLLRDKKPDTRIVSKINDTLHLAYSASAMLFPIYIGTAIWKNLMTNIIKLQVGAVSLADLKLGELSDMDCWRTGLFFARHTPPWLQYGSDELMATDVHDMIVALNKAA